jgi:hypothetical protein
MNPTPITFTTIQTSNLLFYDPDFDPLCFQFCQSRNIDCLPALDDSRKYYRRTEDGFTREEVAQERSVNSQANIFASHVLELFHDNHLLFVYANDELTGVAHFSDYNHPEVDAYLFSLLSSYERSLRRLIKYYGLKNQDMLDFFESKARIEKKADTRAFYTRKIDEYKNKQTQNEKLPVFECFYLQDLIGLINRRKIISLSEDPNRLRNTIMHAKELVHREDANRNDYIYDFDSFEEFFNLVQSLLREYKRVHNKIAYLELERETHEERV